MRLLTLLLIVGLLNGLISGCGQSGKLYFPEDEEWAQQS